ncbi:MAG: hypothetical protein KDJ83_11565 [Rhodobacteraceae bacterium]|nr:hypothetical protein [Paracoccaceae bacterium]
MIEVGKKYVMIILELSESGYEKTSTSVTVTARDGNLIEVDGCEIINTTSPLFHSLADASEKRRAYYSRILGDYEVSPSKDDREV